MEVSCAMGNIILVKPTKQHEADALEYMQEHYAIGEHDLHGASLLEKMSTYDDWLKHLDRQSNADTVSADWVVSNTLFAIDKTRDRLIGVIDIRHELNDFLASYGGHIGYGVRPTERQKGFATKILWLGLEYCKSINLKKIMLACYKNNVASSKTIIKNGGVLEKEFIHSNGKTVQVYWITF